MRKLLDHDLVVAGHLLGLVEIAARIAAEFGDGVWYVDLAPITDPGVVAVAVARALGLPDQPGRSTMDTLLRFVRDRQMLVVTVTHARYTPKWWLDLGRRTGATRRERP